MPIKEFGSKYPQIPNSVKVDEIVNICGDVIIGSDSSIFFGTSIRGDLTNIRIGERTNIQEHCVIH